MYKEARIAIAVISNTVCFTMRIVQRIPALLIIVYVCIGSKYAQRYKQTNNNCGLQRFRCRNGECIVRELLCDGKTDCRDSSDETEAECRKLENLCSIYTFRCNYGACIDRDSVCNGVQDCVDNSDETQPQCTRSAINTQTERPSRRCKMDEFTCSNGQCISNIDMCDGIRNCVDGSDEIFTLCRSLFCPLTAFRCTYGACIDGDLRCNGVVNCVDSSDEAYCSNEWRPSATIKTTQLPLTPTPKRNSVDNSDETQPQYTKSAINTQTERLVRRCKKDEFTCNNGQCISDIDMCNGIRNCEDGSDEMFTLCRSLPCPPTAFRCTYGACIDGDLRCNGVVDCADSSDEDCSNGWRPSATIETTQSPPTPTPKRPSVTPGTNTCRAPPQPLNGRWKLHRSQCSDGQDCNIPEGTELGLGSHLVYSCDSGYKIRGATDVSCSFDGKFWLKVPVWVIIPVCTAILCQALATASTRAECIYNDEWISCKSPVPPKTRATLTCENNYRSETNLLSGQRKNVRCNANGQWEPEPMRCVPVCGTLPVDYKPTTGYNKLGGLILNTKEFPWHASMYREEPGKPKKYFCGASIIQKNLLITAAHCVYDENIKQPIDTSKIYIVTENLFRDDSNLVKKNQVKRIYIKRNYLGFIGNYFSDIAILELVTPFVFSSYLVPACIDTLSDKSVLEPGSYGKVAGFGRTALGESSAILQSMIVPIISLSQCRSASQNVNTKQFITNDKFCAGYKNGFSVCDDGGGLVLRTNNLWYLRGVASVSLGTIHYGGASHCDYNLYSLYTEISRHISWIQDVITKIEQNQTRILCSEQSPTRCS